MVAGPRTVRVLAENLDSSGLLHATAVEVGGLTVVTEVPTAMKISATNGTPQNALVGAAFAMALKATVLDQSGNPLGGVHVTFAAPSSGASGTFTGGQTSVMETTGSNGVATAPAFVANATAGSYTVTASVAGVSTPAAFHLTNVASGVATIQFVGAGFRANATDPMASIVLTRSGNLSATVAVVLSSPGGTDVAPLNETITFGPNITSITVQVPIDNDGKPDETDASIPLSLSSPSAGASLGATTTANLLVHDNNPLPPPVTVSLQLVPVRVTTGKGKHAKTKTETGLQLTFSGAINGAGNLAAYHVFAGRTRRGVTTFKTPVPLSSVNFNPMALTATLTPKSPLNLSLPEQLQITAALLTDNYGRQLDGKHDGIPGTNFVGTFSRKGIQMAQVFGNPELRVLSASAVDALFVEAPSEKRG
jgi:hypothetical protein